MAIRSVFVYTICPVSYVNITRFVHYDSYRVMERLRVIRFPLKVCYANSILHLHDTINQWLGTLIVDHRRRGSDRSEMEYLFYVISVAVFNTAQHEHTRVATEDRDCYRVGIRFTAILGEALPRVRTSDTKPEFQTVSYRIILYALE